MQNNNHTVEKRTEYSFIKIIFILLIFGYGIRAIPYYWEPINYGRNNPLYYMDALNLPFHEFGHFFTQIIGIKNMLLSVWAGTIFQFLTPTLIFIYFLVKRQFYNCSVLLFWIAQCFFYTSYYIKDSRAQILPSALGVDGIHDWYYILSNSHLLQYDQTIGQITLIVGIILLFTSLISGLYFSKKVRLIYKY